MTHIGDTESTMIDDLNKLIFVENPKTATYAIKCALYGEDHLNTPGVRVATINHEIPAVISSKYPLEWRTYLKFVVVRNTWDRAHSFFDFYCRIAGSESYKAIGFDRWVAMRCPPPAEDHLRAPMHGEGRFDDVLCQLRYCEGVDEIIVLHSFDHPSRCQELTDGIARVCARAGTAVPSIPGDKNNYGRSDAPRVWQRDTVSRLMDMHREEIAKFGFREPATRA